MSEPTTAKCVDHIRRLARHHSPESARLLYTAVNRLEATEATIKRQQAALEAVRGLSAEWRTDESELSDGFCPDDDAAIAANQCADQLYEALAKAEVNHE